MLNGFLEMSGADLCMVCFPCKSTSGFHSMLILTSILSPEGPDSDHPVSLLSALGLPQLYQL